MSRKLICIVLLLLLALIEVDLLSTFGEVDNDQYFYNGPRIDELMFLYYGTPDAEIAALQRGEIDVVSDLIRPLDIQTLSSDPDLNVTFALQTHYCYIAFNMRKYPLSDRSFRKALAHLIPRDEISNKLFQGLVVVPRVHEVSPSFGKWFNPKVEIYDYDPIRAEQILRNGGFDFSNEGRLLDPNGEEVRKISFISPTQEEAPTSFEIVKIITENIRQVGIPVEQEAVSFDALLTRVYTQRDFDIYFLCVSNLGLYPRWLFEFYHSSLDVPDGDNTPGVRDEDLDELLYTFRFEDSEEDEALEHIHEAQEMIADLAARIPVYSRYKVEAYRKGWIGKIDHRGVGYFDANSMYTWLRIHREGEDFGGTLKVSVGGKVRTLNPLYGSGAYEAKIWQLIYDSPLSSDPYTGELRPNMAETWSIEDLEDSKGYRQQRIMFNLARNITWQDGEPFTSKDVKFTFDFIIEHKIPLWLPNVQNVIEVNPLDDYTLEILMKSWSLFNLIDIGGIPILPEHIWKDVGDEWRTFQPDSESHPEKPGLTKLMGTGPFVLADYKPGEFWRLQWNPLYFKRHPDKPVGEQLIPAQKTLLPVIAVIVILAVGVGVYFIIRRRKATT